MHFTPLVVHTGGSQLPKGVCVCLGVLPLDYCLKRAGDNPGNSGLSLQEYYCKTVWKNSYAEHELPGTNRTSCAPIFP